MRKALLFPLLLLFFSSGCQNGSTEFTQYQKFEIHCDRDTVLLSRRGVKINIEANTFDCVKSDKIELDFAEVIRKSDMILTGIYSVDANGGILESGGMFRIIDKSTNSQSFRKPVQLEIPASTANAGMSKFSSIDVNGTLTWTNPKNEIGLKGDENIKKGKSLYEQKCTSCHHSDLRRQLIGPALGNVHLFRDKDWLMNFTKDSQQMIAQGDSLAICVTQAYNGSVMTSYPEIGEDDVSSIYEFIANESKLQGIGKSEIEYLTECVIDTTTELAITNVLFDFQSEYAYIVDLASDGWINVDDLLEFETMIEPIVVSMDREYSDLRMVLTFQNRNVVVPFVQNENNPRKYRLLFSDRKDRINFPIEELISIVAYSEKEGFRYKILEYQAKETGNHIELTLDSKDKSEFLKEVENL